MFETSAKAAADNSAFGSRINGSNAALLGVQLRRTLDAGLGSDLPDELMQFIQAISVKRERSE